MSERRLWPRVALDASATIRLDPANADVGSRIINASENGLLLAMPVPRPIGTRMHVNMQIGDPPVEITVSGIIVHVGEDPTAAPGFSARVGVYLTQVTPAWIDLCQRIAATGNILP